MSPAAWTASTLRHARSPMAWLRLVAGLWLFAAGVVLLVAGALAGVRPGPGTLVNMVLIGIFSDAIEYLPGL